MFYWKYALSLQETGSLDVHPRFYASKASIEPLSIHKRILEYGLDFAKMRVKNAF